jgi:hypothetical protein
LLSPDVTDAAAIDLAQLAAILLLALRIEQRLAALEKRFRRLPCQRDQEANNGKGPD